MKTIVKLVLAALVLTAGAAGVSAVASTDKSATVLMAYGYDAGDTGDSGSSDGPRDNGQGCRRCGEGL
jgi:hypothetical protein